MEEEEHAECLRKEKSNGMARAKRWRKEKKKKKKNEGKRKAKHMKKWQLGGKTKRSSLLGSSSKSKIEFLEVEMLVS